MKNLKLLWQYITVVIALLFAGYHFIFGEKLHRWILGILWIGVAGINLNREMKKKKGKVKGLR